MVFENGVIRVYTRRLHVATHRLLDLPAPVFGSEFSTSPPLLGALGESINLRNCDDFPASTFTLLPRLKVDLEGTVESGEDDGGRISFEGDNRRMSSAAEDSISSSAFLRLVTTVVSFTP